MKKAILEKFNKLIGINEERAEIVTKDDAVPKPLKKLIEKYKFLNDIDDNDSEGYMNCFINHIMKTKLYNEAIEEISYNIETKGEESSETRDSAMEHAKILSHFAEEYFII